MTKLNDNKIKKIGLIVSIIALAIIFLASMYLNPAWMIKSILSIETKSKQIASVILFNNPKTIAQIRARYNSAIAEQPKVKILLVPGHEPNYGGAEYGKRVIVRERDLNLELAQNLQKYLAQNSRYEIIISRDANIWNPQISNYFTDNWQTIMDWRQAAKAKTVELTSINTVKTLNPIQHNDAPENVAVRLYGIHKWANEQDVDIEIHIHFNDNVRSNVNKPGEYSGAAINVPSEQYYNSTSTKAVATTIFKRLEKYYPISNLPGESVGIVDEPDLIAIGSNNTADAASLLIEYGYIYEPQIVNPETRSLVINDLAFQTYLGLHDFFDPEDSRLQSKTFSTTILPYIWKNNLSENNASPKDMYALQTALQFEGLYPSSDKSLNQCPRTGIMGNCTRLALKAFQEKYGIQEKNIMGKMTIQKLNEIYNK